METTVVSQWDKDCMRYVGRVLRGRWAHWCDDWGDMPIDETLPVEFAVCTCDLSRPGRSEEELEQARELAYAGSMKINGRH